MKRVLLDQGLAPRAAVLLRSEGWEALHVSEAGLDRAEDQEILEYARQRGMTCVTFDVLLIRLGVRQPPPWRVRRKVLVEEFGDTAHSPSEPDSPHC